MPPFTVLCPPCPPAGPAERALVVPGWGPASPGLDTMSAFMARGPEVQPVEFTATEPFLPYVPVFLISPGL